MTRMAIVIAFCCALQVACTQSREQHRQVDDGMPLHCAGCAFVEDRGVRLFAGRLTNDSGAPIDDISLAMELQDTKGKAVVSGERLAVPALKGIQPQTTREFRVIVPQGDDSITQGVIHFERAETRERLSVSIPLMLVVRLAPQ